MKYNSKKDAKKAMKKWHKSLDPAGVRKVTCIQGGIKIEFYSAMEQLYRMNKYRDHYIVNFIN